MKFKYLVIFMLGFLSLSIANAQSTFKIVFVSSPPATTTTWLTKIATDWGATGISLEARWGDIDVGTTPGTYNWSALDAAINAITNYQYDGKDLDLYIRVSMGVTKPAWVTPGGGYFTTDDFQIDGSGTIYSYPGGTSDRVHPLNFVSSNSKYYMHAFFNAVLDHINNTFPTKTSRIKEIVPCFSTEEESEYPHDQFTGYSTYEIDAFKSYLQTIYPSISALNQKWDPNGTSPISDFSNVAPKSYYWDSTVNSYYIYPAGRTDWINFRTLMLANFMSEFASEASYYGFEVGAQFGSIYDNFIEKRGWVDPTSIVASMNSVHVADVFWFAGDFDFAADYLRSIANYWTSYRGGDPFRFSTETDWPGISDSGALFESQKWAKQLTTYYHKGAYEHYIFGFSTDPTTLDSYKTSYAVWRDTLLHYSNAPLVQISNAYAIHLGCEQVLENHNTQTSGRFELHNSILAQSPYSGGGGNYDGGEDIVTNYMIDKYPWYLNNYAGISFTKSSQWITDQAYLGLMTSSVTTPYANVTWFSDGGHGEYAFTEGLKNEYLEYRSPIHLIWRQRPDLQAIWPDANLPAYGSGQSVDFVAWSYLIGAGYLASQPSAYREYPGWELKDGGSTGNYKYDKNIRAVWNSRGDLQSVFPNAHSTTDNSSNMISWAKDYGYGESDLLAGYWNWPYIGDGRSFSKKALAGPRKSSLEAYNLTRLGSTLVFNYKLDKSSNVAIKIYDLHGKQVAGVTRLFTGAGAYEVPIDASVLQSGMHVYTIGINGHIAARQLLSK